LRLQARNFLLGSRLQDREPAGSRLPEDVQQVTDEVTEVESPIRCDHCGGPFGLRRHPQVRTRRDTKQFCCRRCAAEYRMDVILRAYWLRMSQMA
jgi:hypothetical protein